MLYISKGQSLPQKSCSHSSDINPVSKIVFCQRQVIQDMLDGVATSEVLKLKNEDAGLEFWMKAMSHWTSGVPQSVWAMSDGPSTR